MLSVTLYNIKLEDTSMVVHTPPLGWNSWNTFGEEINELNKDTERLVEQVTELVRSRRGRVIPAEIMDDPVKLLAMYLDHC